MTRPATLLRRSDLVRLGVLLLFCPASVWPADADASKLVSLLVTLGKHLNEPDPFEFAKAGLVYQGGSIAWTLPDSLTFSFGTCRILAVDGERDRFRCTVKTSPGTGNSARTANSGGSPSATESSTTARKAEADRQATLLFSAADAAMRKLPNFQLDLARSGTALRIYVNRSGTIQVTVKPSSLEVEAEPLH